MEEDPTRLVADDRPNRRPHHRLARRRQLTKPSEPLVVPNGRVRRRGRRKDEELRVVQAPLLDAELRPLVERTAVGLFPDERDPRRMESLREPCQPFRRAREVRPTKVSRARRRPVGRVRQPEAERRQVVLLLRCIQPRRESRVVEQAPEVVPRVRKVGTCGRRPPARVDAAEDHSQRARKHVRNRAGRLRVSPVASS